MNKQCQKPQAHPDRCGCVREIAEHNAQAYAEAIAALAAKDARIAELESENSHLRHGMTGDYDLDAWLEWCAKKDATHSEDGRDAGDFTSEEVDAAIDALEGKPARQQAEPKGCTKPDCFPYCDCGTIDDYVPPAATHSEGGREVVGYRVEWKTNPKGSVRKTLADQKPTIQLLEMDYPSGVLIGYEELMTVAQHSRIVAAKDAEIDLLRLEAAGVERVKGELAELLDCADEPRWKWILLGVSKLRAQPGRQVGDWPKLDKPAKVGCVRFRAGVSAQLVVEAAQRQYEYDVTPEKEAERIAEAAGFLGSLQGASQMGGDERAKFNAWNNGTDCPLAGRDTKTGAWMAWQARAALAPAAVVMPERMSKAAFSTAEEFEKCNVWNAALDAVARLNRRAIPVGLIEASRRAADILGSQGFAAWDQLAAELRALLSQQQEGGV